MELYDDGKVGKALEPHFVETHAGNLHVYEDRTQVGDIVFITTDKFKKYIPIEWIKKYLEPFYEYYNALSPESREVCGAGWVIDVLETMMRDWEKENEK